MLISLKEMIEEENVSKMSTDSKVEMIDSLIELVVKGKVVVNFVTNVDLVSQKMSIENSEEMKDIYVYNSNVNNVNILEVQSKIIDRIVNITDVINGLSNRVVDLVNIKNIEDILVEANNVV